MVEGMASQYLGGADADNPLASPLYADYAGLPPCCSRSETPRSCWQTRRA